ncbi:MAG: trigger factor [Lachnospiraceae bacterium]|nr:trigger factor [Lachnospiraceae bacterium]
MSVKVENLEHNLAKLTMEVSAEDFDKAVEGVYQRQKKNINIPGFRKGKVPRVMIEKMYGKTIFFEDAANDVIQQVYPTEAEASGLRILSRPDQITPEQLEPGKPFIFSAVVAVYPESVEVGEYKGVEVPINVVVVSDEEVDEELKKQQQKNAREITVDERPAQMGDTVNIDYAGTIDGVAFDGGTAEGQDLKLGSNQFIPGFEVQLVGVGIGEEKDLSVIFPENYGAKELAGKAAVFHCKVNSIKTTELPELDDEFAQDVSEFDTLEEYKASILSDLKDKKAEQAKREKRQAAVDKVAKAAVIDIPELLVKDQAESMAEAFANQIQQQGLDFGQYLQYMNMPYDQFVANYREQAEKELRTSFVLEKVAELEGIEVDDERVQKEIEDTAKSYGMEPEQYRSYMADGYEEEVRHQLKLGMAADVILEAAVETEAATQEAEDAEKAAAKAVEDAIKQEAEAGKTEEAAPEAE